MKTITPNDSNPNNQPNESQIQEYLLHYLESDIQKIMTKNKENISKSPYGNLKPQILLKLLLNFETFDTLTIEKDVNMPSEKVINFGVAFIKINIHGRMIVSQDRKRERARIKYSNDYPKGAFGVVIKKSMFYIR